VRGMAGATRHEETAELVTESRVLLNMRVVVASEDPRSTHWACESFSEKVTASSGEALVQVALGDDFETARTILEASNERM